MNLLDVLSFIASVVAALVAILAYRRSRLADEANAKYEEIRKRLAEIELRQAESADVKLHFVPAGRGQFDLIVTNAGSVDAHDVTVSLETMGEGDVPPMLEAIEPVSKLAQGQSVTVARTILGSGMSRRLSGMWRWKNANGREVERESVFQLV